MRPPPFRILLALIPVLLVPACIPVVTHAPRVHPGLAVGTVAAIATDPVLTGEVRTGQSTVTPVIAPSSVFARVGWTPDNSGVPLPVSLGVSVPIALPFSVMHPEADAYVQLSPASHPTLAAGAGVLLSRSYTTPYAQIGRDLDDDVSLYTTQSVAFFHGGDRAPDATLWMPAAALKFSEYSVFVQAGLGRERLGADSTRAVRFLMVGGAVELRDRAIPRF
ncbi:hypothetical protein [Longimicrobium terrae]|uniref:Uncharacterized protein n=1 Tax=Longimicrobium terrae TaxID=1639882 RepID=A0A841H5D5_9BACT|nr:hypothetical protein [Longimicrobium terrae]MBB4638857.1 hypothetical protein [Longimicrobium terrae]MBB6073096.1 hypothetical protein [Longimicrobium terrae]NNC30213.1 hypothetical protein [Longimicrobium terrae]